MEKRKRAISLMLIFFIEPLNPRASATGGNRCPVPVEESRIKDK